MDTFNEMEEDEKVSFHAILSHYFIRSAPDPSILVNALGSVPAY